jgi:hypothetical protein
MQLVWTLPSPEEETAPPIQAFIGQYQDMLRAVGAWVDARGFRLTGISGSGDALLVEVETSAPGDDTHREAFRLDYVAIERLVRAAQLDRNRF